MNIEYSIENNKPIIHFFRREKGIRVHHKIEDFEPYFYVDESDIVPDDPRIVRTEVGFKNILGEPVRKIIVKLPGDVRDLRQMFTNRLGVAECWVIEDKSNTSESCSGVKIYLVD